MKEKLFNYGKELLIFFIILAVTANLVSLYKSNKLNNARLEKDSFELINGSIYKINKTKPVLVHVWGSWCPTCKLEASNIEFISKRFQVITFAVKSGNNEQIIEWMKEHNYTFKVVNDQSGAFARTLKTFAYPTTFIYDSEGNLEFSDVGYTSTLGLYIRMLWSSL